jgi:hypothetical protein
LFNIRTSTGAQPDWFAQRLLERLKLTLGGPQLQLRVSGCAELHEIFFTPIVQLDPAYDLGVAAIERLGEAEDRRERPDSPPLLWAQRAEIGVPFSRRCLAMISRDQRNNLRLLRLEAPQISILDQVIGMFVMARIADMAPDIMEQRGKLEPFALAIAEPVYSARLIEN